MLDRQGRRENHQELGGSDICSIKMIFKQARRVKGQYSLNKLISIYASILCRRFVARSDEISSFMVEVFVVGSFCTSATKCKHKENGDY
jgi:hypothetical protein